MVAKAKVVGQDLTGRRFGSLICLGRSERLDNSGSRSFEVVKCDCGVEKEVYLYALLHGRTKSCGCQRVTYCRRAKIRHARASTGRQDRTYRAWSSMLDRCYNPNNKRWNRYGGRGIEVAKAWRSSFETFLRDVGESPGAGYQLDRENNNGHYEPGNCRWLTSRANQNNRSNNRHISAFGRTLTLAQWSRATGINTETIRGRLYRGWTVEETLTHGATMVNDLTAVRAIACAVDRHDSDALRSAIEKIIKICNARLLDDGSSPK